MKTNLKAIEKSVRASNDREMRRVKRLIAAQFRRLPEMKDPKALDDLAWWLRFLMDGIAYDRRVLMIDLQMRDVQDFLSLQLRFPYRRFEVRDGRAFERPNVTYALESVDGAKYQLVSRRLCDLLQMLGKIARRIGSPIYSEIVNCLVLCREYTTYREDFSQQTPEQAKALAERIFRCGNFIAEELRLMDVIPDATFPDLPDYELWPPVEPDDDFNLNSPAKKRTPQEETDAGRAFQVDFYRKRNTVFSTPIKCKDGSECNSVQAAAEIMKNLADEMVRGRQYVFSGRHNLFFPLLRRILSTETAITYRVYKGDALDEELVLRAHDRMKWEAMPENPCRLSIVKDLARYIDAALKLAIRHGSPIAEKLDAMARILSRHQKTICTADEVCDCAFTQDMKALVCLLRETSATFWLHINASKGSMLNASLDRIADALKRNEHDKPGPKLTRIQKMQIVEGVDLKKRPGKIVQGNRDPNNPYASVVRNPNVRWLW